MRPLLNRTQEIARLRGKLERDGTPRLQMLLIVAITGGVGFLASYALLRTGLTEMWLRYPLALGIAYLAFLCLLWLWLRTRTEDYADAPDFSGISPSGHGGDSAPIFSGQGGNFGGGGANSAYHHPTEAPSIDTSAEDADDGGVLGEALGDAATEAFTIPLLVVAMVGVLLLSSFWVVYSAPTLFAELLVDGVLAAGLYRRLRGIEHQHWLETAIRRTIWPFILTAMIIGAVAWGMKLYAPEARSIGEVIFHAKYARWLNNRGQIDQAPRKSGQQGNEQTPTNYVNPH